MHKTAPWVLLALLAAGCDPRGPSGVACAAYAAAGLGVSVTDAASGQPLCDAAVTAAEGTYSERLIAVGCTFAGAYERPGSYAIRAERTGYATREVSSVRVVMGGGECPHVEQAKVTIALSPRG